MAKPRILVVGNTFFELNLHVKNMPYVGEKIDSLLPYDFTPNSRSLISAVAGSQFGSDVLFCTKVGNDNFGNRVKYLCLDNNIDTRFVFVDKKRPTGLNTYIHTSDSSPCVISCAGSNSALNESDLEEAFVSYPDSVLIYGELPTEILFEVINLSNAKKIPVMFDPDGADFNEFNFNALGNLEIFTLNAHQAKSITGIEPDDFESCLKSCIKIINMIKCHYIVIKLGVKGCFVFDGVYSEIIPFFETVTEDSGAANEAFNAGLLHMYLKSGDIVKGAVFANLCYSLTLSRSGILSAIPEHDDIKDFIIKNRLNFNE